MSSPDVSLYVGPVVSVLFVMLVGSKSVTLAGTDLDRTGVGKGGPCSRRRCELEILNHSPHTDGPCIHEDILDTSSVDRDMLQDRCVKKREWIFQRRIRHLRRLAIGSVYSAKAGYTAGFVDQQ